MPSLQRGWNSSSRSSFGIRAGAGLAVLALHAAVIGATLSFQRAAGKSRNSRPVDHYITKDSRNKMNTFLEVTDGMTRFWLF